MTSPQHPKARGCSLPAVFPAVLPVRLLVAVGELALDDLAGRVARQLIEEDEVARHLVPGQVVPDVAPEGVGHLLRVVGLSPVEDDERAEPLAELLVVDAD